MSTKQHGYYDYDDNNNNKNSYDINSVNDSISIGNYLWLATKKGVIKINQTTRERTEYTTKNSDIPSNEVESIAANRGGGMTIGTYGRSAAFMNDDGKWEAIPYTSNLFDEKTEIKEDGRVFIGGDEDNWLRTNFIHFDINDTLWVGTSEGLLKLQDTGKERKWEGPFNPADREEPLNVLFIRDVERGIEISGNYGKRGYEQPIEDIKTYLLPNIVSDTDWRAMTEEVITGEAPTIPPHYRGSERTTSPQNIHKASEPTSKRFYFFQHLRLKVRAITQKIFTRNAL